MVLSLSRAEWSRVHFYRLESEWGAHAAALYHAIFGALRAPVICKEKRERRNKCQIDGIMCLDAINFNSRAFEPGER